MKLAAEVASGPASMRAEPKAAEGRTTLEDAGYATVEKTYEGRRPRTWIRITKAGRRALAQEIALLKTLIERLDTGVATSSSDE